MKQYIAKRILHSLIVIWAVATAVFFGLRAIPGGPARAMLGEQATEEAVAALREQMGLNEPLYVQYASWMIDLIQLDFGVSMRSGEAVTTLVFFQAAPKTLSIAVVGILIGLAIAIPTGVISATRKNEPVDHAATVGAFLGLSMPAFFIGILLVAIVGVRFGLLPVVGYNSLLNEGLVPWFKSIILPGIAVGLPYAAIVMRMMRSELLEVLNQPYMQSAHAKGVAQNVRLYKHAFQNALIPVVTIAGIQIATILVGSVTVELVFSINGVGRVLVTALLQQDYTQVQGAILFVAVIMVGANLVVDIVYTVIDPNIKYEG